MLRGKLLNRLDRKRLRNLLALLFLALAIPTAVLIAQAYRQLKWEAFHQYRSVAESTAQRIDASSRTLVAATDARTFADYAFLVVSGDAGSNFVQRSELSAYPVSRDIPGLLGYFQVGARGEFSTPLLPQQGVSPDSVGLSDAEYRQRLELADSIQSILTDNRLLSPRARAARRDLTPADDTSEERQRMLASEAASPPAAAPESVVARFGFADSAAPETVAESELEETYSQQVFDELAAAGKQSASGNGGRVEADESDQVEAVRANVLAKLGDLELDENLEQKSAIAERDQPERQAAPAAAPLLQSRAKRKEEIAVAEVTADPAYSSVANLPDSTDYRITTFESELDPMEFSQLDSGHFVLFRKVWRDGERFIQGMLLDRDQFVRGIVDPQLAGTALAEMSTLIVAYQDDVIHTVRGGGYEGYSGFDSAFDGSLLYRSRLSAPLGGLQLIFSIDQLPPGAGAGVLVWLTLVLAAVFLGGFYTLYRLGASQIDLARQQQDFVSAVSHELKTPLTSIRMYGEMLKEGWADADKRQSYYEFIHEESERLTRLISNVLQLARITRNEPKLEMKRIRVDRLVNQVESKIATQVQRAGFELSIDTDEHAAAASILIDEDSFVQIAINLVDNALKFSRDAAERKISIGVRLSPDRRVVFAIRDHGPGIPPDQLRKIFELFYRSESELTRETVGTGIGLAIVHQLCMAMNGTVDVVNRQPGAEFRMSFPAAD